MIPFKPAITGTRPILFTVPAGDDYYDLNETKLEIKVRMNTLGTGGLSSNETGASDANNTKYVYCVNNFGHSFFNQMNVSFNGVLMTEHVHVSRLKPYRQSLRVIANPRQSIKRRKHLMTTQIGAGAWKELNRCYHCAKTLYHY